MSGGHSFLSFGHQFQVPRVPFYAGAGLLQVPPDCDCAQNSSQSSLLLPATASFFGRVADAGVDTALGLARDIGLLV